MIQMKILKTELNDVYIIKNQTFSDSRGKFIKIYNKDLFDDFNLDIDFKEQYYSISNKNVIRGMHFQLPPYNHTKLVSVIRGKAQDVILDLRKSSNTYGKFTVIELSENDKISVYIPSGFAHGFKSLENKTIMLYNVSTVYNKECDTGILWNSFGFDWNIEGERGDFILSDRDKSFIELKNFRSPF